MKVLERFCRAKFRGSENGGEDIVFVSDDFAAVIDGVTSLKKKEDPGVSAGRLAAELVAGELAETPRTADAAETMRRLDDAIRDHYIRTGTLKEARRDYGVRCGASVIVYSEHRRELWRVGDCKALIDAKEWEAGKIIDDLLAEVRAYFLESELRRGKTREELLETDTGRTYIGELLARQIDFQNSEEPSPYNYHVLDGFFPASGNIERRAISREVSDLVLASDGYPILRGSLAESEAELANILREDPLCFRIFKTTKGLYRGNISFDDRSYLRLDVNAG